MEFFTSVDENGKMQRNTSGQIAVEVAMYKKKRIKITIDIVKSNRSQQQNRLWWLYMTILSKEIGYTKEETHDICKFKFLKREKVIEATGEILPYLQSTTKLSKSEFSDMTSELIRWAAETFNIILPLPNTQIDMEL